MKIGYVAFLSIALLLLNPYTSSADEIYTVRNGDNLYRISKKYKVGVEAIREANNLDIGQLRAGTRLTIPSRESKAEGRSPKTARYESVHCKAMTQRDADTQEVHYHIVKKGETLFSISMQHSLSVESLKELNNLQRSNRLRAGQYLIIKKTGQRTYTVQRDDTIWKIAKRFNIDVDELMEINEVDSEDLKTGQKLLLEEPIEQADTALSYTTMPSALKINEETKTLSEAPDSNSLRMKERLILFAKKMLDIPYRFGGSGLFGIDCSGYVQKVFGFLKIPLPRTAREQFSMGESVNKEELSIGDLVFFRTYAPFPSHVGIYLGNNLFIHASSRWKKVTIDSLDTPFYIRRFIGGKRILLDGVERKGEPAIGG